MADLREQIARELRDYRHTSMSDDHLAEHLLAIPDIAAMVQRRTIKIVPAAQVTFEED